MYENILEIRDHFEGLKVRPVSCLYLCCVSVVMLHGRFMSYWSYSGCNPTNEYEREEHDNQIYFVAILLLSGEIRTRLDLLSIPQSGGGKCQNV